MSESARPQNFGRVEEDGTVYVITANGERQVGQVPGVSKAEALAFFERRFDSLRTEVDLLVQRVESNSVSPEEARKSIANLQATITEANAVGDLAGLVERLEALKPQIEAAQEARRAARAQQNEETRAAKEKMVAEAERLAQSNDWRGGVNRFRNLLEEWKKLPRIDRATDDELWHRFSSARTTYTRRRKAQFAVENEKREAARKAKEEILVRAHEIADSTEWAATSAEFRDLMAQWKAAGGAGRNVDDQLWAEFRGLQDKFFGARTAAQNEEDTAYRANQEAKEKLLDEIEATMLPVEDIKQARAQFRDFLAAYNEVGRVPREAIRPLENRVRSLEQALKQAEENEWRRTDPQARQRAADTVEMFRSQIEKLSRQVEAAEAKGDKAKAAKLRESIDTYAEWLSQAEQALEEFTN